MTEIIDIEKNQEYINQLIQKEEKRKQYNKEYYRAYNEKNKERLAKQRKEYFERNRARLIEKKRQNYTYDKEAMKKYYEDNKDKKKEYYKNNREKIIEQNKDRYHRMKKKPNTTTFDKTNILQFLEAIEKHNEESVYEIIIRKKAEKEEYLSQAQLD